MISVLSAVVLMVAIGTVIQRADLISGGSTEDATVLNPDLVDARPNRLLRIDVFGNDDGVTEQDRDRLALVGQPSCGQVFVQGQALQFLPDSSCVGQQVIEYGIRGKDDLVGQVIAQMTGTQALAAQEEPKPEPAPTPQVVAAASQSNQTESSPAPQTEPSAPTISTSEEVTTVAALPVAESEPVTPEKTAASGVVETLISGTAQQAAASTRDAATNLIEPEETAETKPTRAVEIELAEPNPTRITAAVLGTPETRESATAPETQLAAREVERSETGPALTAGTTPAPARIVKPQIRLAAPTLDVRPPEDQRRVSTPDQFDLATVNAAETAPQRATPVSSTPALDTEGDSGFLVAVVPRREPNTKAPDGLRVTPSREVALRNAPALAVSRQGDAGVRVSRADPTQIVGAPNSGLSDALPSSPVDASQPVPGPSAVVSSTPPPSKPLLAATGDATEPLQQGEAASSAISGDRDAPESPEVPSSDQLAALPRHDAPCVIPPAMTIDVRRAARSIISVDAPCHADTVAELEYSSLRIAVPLDSKGRGSQMVLGFEPNAPALLSFVNGETIDFDLPFKGIGRISRVAVVWDLPVNLELNAIEFGGTSGSAAHVNPNNPRRFEDVRRTGGGFLNTYRSYAGIGQNAQIYSFWHRRGGQQGVVELMIDYASRNRDLLDGTCGDGKYAAPNFLILRSEDARLERPIIRKLAAIECSRVAEEKGDKRLISGAVADLLVVQR